MNGFALDEHQAMSVLSGWNACCQPPWSEKDLRHKIADAIRLGHAKGRGFLLRASSYRPNTPSTANRLPAVKPAPSSYDLSDFTELPDAVEDGARLLLKTCFQPSEGVRIVNARLDDDGGEIPDGAGPCLSREEWLRKLDAGKGNPNSIFSSSKKTGIYICINPLKIGGSKDADVTAFRHALLEFDKELSPEEQFNLYQKSRLPCAAIIFSGKKSVHAWVKIDAVDRQEYDDRVRMLYDHFESSGYKIDVKNKNPSRLSRLPNCIRFDGRQELLAVSTTEKPVGCESFSEWQGEVQADGIGKLRTVDDLLAFDAAKDENSIVGQRWLCRAGSALLIGPSGVGKSSLMLQMFVLLAIGRTIFGGLSGSRPLKIVVVQAENDEGDLAEMMQGVYAGIELLTDAEEELLRKNLIFIRDSSHTGFQFTDAVRRIIDRHRPDIVGLDPLLSFIGADISRQEVCSQFLRNWMNPIADVTGVAWFFIHHTGKPSHDPKSKKHWQTSDYGYSGIGSSELTNWARAIIVLEQAAPGVFRLLFPKRGKRAGVTQLDGTPATTIWLRHAEKGIFWRQIEQPEESKAEHKGKPNDVLRIAGSNLHPFLSACLSEGEGKTAISQRLEGWLASQGEDLSTKSCGRIVEKLVANHKLTKTDKALYIKGPNA